MLRKTETTISRRKGILVLIVSCFILVLIFALNHYMPLLADDYSYSFSFLTGERITSVSQIIPSQMAHYQRVNGRFITHTLAQFFLLIGEDAFDVVNSVAFLGLLYLIYFHGCGTFKNFSVTRFVLIGILLFLTAPKFGESYLWTAGASNYLYGMITILCVMIPYRLQAEGKTVFSSLAAKIFMAVAYLFFGILAGWTSENVSVAMIAMMIAYMIWYRAKSIKIQFWNISGCVGGIIGCLFMLLAPGTAHRMDQAGGSGGILMWIKRFVIHSTSLVIYTQLIMILLLAVLGVYLYQKRQLFVQTKGKNIVLFVENCGIPLIYLLGFLGAVYSMIVSPSFPERAWSGPIVLLLIAVCGFSTLVDMSGSVIKTGKIAGVAFALVLFLATYFHAFVELRHVNADFQERVSTIETSLANGEGSVEIPSIYGLNDYCGYSQWGDLNLDSAEWPNTAIARYYGADEIIRMETQID